jgi:hypothetical protein
MSRDIFGENSNNGEYGTSALEAVIDTANILYDGYDQIVADDGVVNANDFPDVFTVGTRLFGSVSSLVPQAGQLDEEILDLSEAEKNLLAAKAGERINNPGYKKIISGLLDIVDGIAEQINANNPVD